MARELPSESFPQAALSTYFTALNEREAKASSGVGASSQGFRENLAKRYKVELKDQTCWDHFYLVGLSQWLHRMDWTTLLRRPLRS